MSLSEQQPSVDLHEERLTPAVRQFPYRRLRVAKRIVVEQRTVTVDVRREELVIEEMPLDTSTGGGSVPSPGGEEPLVLVLSQEVPDEVRLRTEPVEIVRVHVDRLTESKSFTSAVRRERAEVQETPAD